MLPKNLSKKSFLDYLFTLGSLFLVILFLAKLFYLKELKLPLSYDESYYWDWSRNLDWGYYSKPPMIAWILALSTHLLGNSEYAIRLPALIFITLSILVNYILILKYFGETLARWTLFTLNFVPLFTIYSFVMTIDPPLIFFWSLSLYFLITYLENPTYKRTFLTGLTIGLGLLTKQTMFAFLILTFLYLYIFDKDKLKLKKTWLIFLISFLVYLPNILWNFQHGFVLFKHTEEHFSRKTVNFFSFFEFLGGLIVAYSLLWFPLFAFFSIKYLKLLKNFFLKKHLPVLEKFLFQFKILNLFFIFSFPILASLLFLSFFIKININWIFPFFISGFLFTIVLSFQKNTTKFLMFLNVLLAFVLSLFIYILPKNPDYFSPKISALLNKFLGWIHLAQEVEKVYDGKTPLVASSRDIASSLAFYLKSHPEIYVVQLKKYPENQYHLWKKSSELEGKEILLVKKWLDEPKYLKFPLLIKTVKIEKIGKVENYSIWRGILNLEEGKN
ncbi:MAG: glycosyltransferase family 39 protein [Thermodesulfobacteriaceae bacterium]|nr:glycosyltransferase family 39 protein [Thermodesulfobacteriaceae bacterium]MCX8042072.1 glycosyltransferase family 39 protein [Thermodesulfobacteriaceae bacterium]MDW8136465.1 glycosyltransferase family 39 protein [Thermodesulfobacterium sp.]